MPPYLQDVKRLKHNHQLLENFKYGLSNHVTGQGSSKLIMVKYIMCTFASSQLVVSSKEATKVLGVDRRRHLKDGSCWTHQALLFGQTTKKLCVQILSKHFWHLVFNSLQGILFIHTHVFVTFVQINLFFVTSNMTLGKNDYSRINDYKMVCNCIRNLYL
jgi:hypothetical protein